MTDAPTKKQELADGIFYFWLAIGVFASVVFIAFGFFAYVYLF